MLFFVIYPPSSSIKYLFAFAILTASTAIAWTGKGFWFALLTLVVNSIVFLVFGTIFGVLSRERILLKIAASLLEYKGSGKTVTNWQEYHEGYADYANQIHELLAKYTTYQIIIAQNIAREEQVRFHTSALGERILQMASNRPNFLGDMNGALNLELDRRGVGHRFRNRG